MLGQVLFNIFVGDMDSEMIADDSKLSGATDTVEGRDAIQRDMDRLERWACANLIKFNKSNCKVLHLGQGYLKCRYSLGRQQLESSPEEKDLEVSIGERFSMSQQCALATQKASSILGSREVWPAGQGRRFCPSTLLS